MHGQIPEYPFTIVFTGLFICLGNMVAFMCLIPPNRDKNDKALEKVVERKAKWINRVTYFAGAIMVIGFSLMFYEIWLLPPIRIEK